MTEQEQNYYYGDYMVYDFFSKDFHPLYIDGNTINGHPYQVLNCTKSPSGVYLYLQFTEFPDAYTKRDTTLENQYDEFWLEPDGAIFTNVSGGLSADLSYYNLNTGWNVKYGKPAWALRKEQEVGKQAAG